jgi:glycerophosphoryl diester phosphodiesterase
LPEHTFPAKALAVAMGADYLEQDVVATSDDELVVLHDVHLDRVTDVEIEHAATSSLSLFGNNQDIAHGVVHIVCSCSRTDHRHTHIEPLIYVFNMCA